MPLPIAISLNLPSRWGKGIHRTLWLGVGESTLSPPHGGHTLRFTPADVLRLATAIYDTGRHLAEPETDAEFLVSLDWYPERDEEWEPEFYDDVTTAWIAIFVSFGEITISISQDGQQEFATMTPNEFSSLVTEFKDVEALLRY